MRDVAVKNLPAIQERTGGAPKGDSRDKVTVLSAEDSGNLELIRVYSELRKRPGEMPRWWKEIFRGYMFR